MIQIPQKRHKGFTLVELIITTAIISIMAGITIHLVVAGFNAWFEVSGRRIILQQSRTTMDHLFRTLGEEFATGRYHSATSHPAVGTFDVSATEIVFVAVSRDADASPSEYPWDYEGGVRYLFDFANQEIEWDWREAAAWQDGVLASVVQNNAGIAFLRYFDNANTEIASPVAAAEIQNINSIEINITNETPDGEEAFTTKTAVFPRNQGHLSPYTGP